MFFSNNNKFAESSHKHIATTQEVWQTSLHGFAKIMQINLDVSKKLLNTMTNSFQAATKATKPEDFAHHMHTLTQEAIAHQVSHAQNTLAAIQDTHQKVGQVFGQHIEIENARIKKTVSNMSEFAPLAEKRSDYTK